MNKLFYFSFKNPVRSPPALAFALFTGKCKRASSLNTHGLILNPTAKALARKAGLFQWTKVYVVRDMPRGGDRSISGYRSHIEP